MLLPLYLLAMAVFAMGTSEFMLAGLVPDIASDLDVTVGAAGSLTSAFAIGMIIGAPLMAALSRNWPQRTSLLGFVLVFLAAHAVAATTASFPVLFATRVAAALANAGFLAVALTTAATLVPSDKKGRALAVLLSGTTVATIAGVPGDRYWAHCSGGEPLSGPSLRSVCPLPSASSKQSRRARCRTTRSMCPPCDLRSHNSEIRD